MRVAFAHVGARVRWHGEEMMTLERVKIRGVESAGMICAAAELDLATRFPPASEKEVIDLGDGDDGVGKDLRSYLGLNDVIFHIDNHAITHRPDLFSQIGFARELVALGIADWKKATKKNLSFTKQKHPFKCIVDNDTLVTRYESCVLEMDSVGETPAWMRHRLEATGWRSVSLPVDITNYVATETGMPLHCFDADDIRGDFHIRESKAGETIVTLDGKERVLPAGAIVLSDREGIFDLLGIMGGLRSSTKEGTRRVYLHAAACDPSRIRRAVIATGHRTEASTVYEKGIPREAVDRGLRRAIELFLELVPGARIVSSLESWGDDGKPKPMTLSLQLVTDVLGRDVGAKEIKRILTAIGCTVVSAPSKKNAALRVTPPLHRLGDLKTPIDLVEEVGRIAGYETFQPTMPAVETAVAPREDRLRYLRHALARDGFNELLPLSLTGPGVLRRCGYEASDCLAIINPLGEELGTMQPSTLPALLEHAERSLPLFLEQLNRSTSGRLIATLPSRERELRTFTCGHVFAPDGTEQSQIGVLVAAPVTGDDHDRVLHEPLLTLRQSLNDVVGHLGYSLDVAPHSSSLPYVHPGRTGELFLQTISKGGMLPQQRVGTIFEVHPTVLGRFGLSCRVAVALLDTASILSLPVIDRSPTAVPQFPAVHYDVTLPYRSTEHASDLLKRLRGAHEFLESVAVKDIYTAANAPAGTYALTLSCTYRAPDRTLSDDEASAIHAKILSGAGVETSVA
jgi:phenylalanyl-tRNA synthetase beta chain